MPGGIGSVRQQSLKVDFKLKQYSRFDKMINHLTAFEANAVVHKTLLNHLLFEKLNKNKGNAIHFYCDNIV